MDSQERHFEKDLYSLWKEVLRLGSLGQEAIEKAISALIGRNSDLAREVIEGDEALDQQELLIDELCVDLLGLQQPIASDLRFITVALKFTPEIERMGDLAVNISERALELNKAGSRRLPGFQIT